MERTYSSVHKITSGILSSLLKVGVMKSKLVKVWYIRLKSILSNEQNTWKSPVHPYVVWAILWISGNSKFVQRLLVEASHIEFQQNLGRCLWKTWRSPYISLCQLGSINMVECWNWRVSSSGMWRHTVCWVAPDVSEEHIASIFRVEELVQQAGATQRTTRRHIPEDDTLHNHHCENLKSYNVGIVQQSLVEVAPYQISTKSLTMFMEYWEKSIYCLTYTRLFYESVWLKIGMAL
jgi:hypothetical protein